jgi:hypothetical protein
VPVVPRENMDREDFFNDDRVGEEVWTTRRWRFGIKIAVIRVCCLCVSVWLLGRTCPHLTSAYRSGGGQEMLVLAARGYRLAPLSLASASTWGPSSDRTLLTGSDKHEVFISLCWQCLPSGVSSLPASNATTVLASNHCQLSTVFVVCAVFHVAHTTSLCV